jgi:D5 N terminal like
MSNHNDPALGESLSRRGKYAPTPDINGHTEHIPAPDEHPDDPVPPPRQVAPVNHSGQVRMAYRLTHAHRGRLLHVHNVGWHYWDGTRWTPDDVGAAKRAVLDVLRTALADSIGDKELQRDIRSCESDSGVHGVLLACLRGRRVMPTSEPDKRLRAELAAELGWYPADLDDESIARQRADADRKKTDRDPAKRGHT